MKLADIINEWDKDSIIKKDDIIGESVKIPRLHHKYYGFMLNELSTERQLSTQFKDLEYKKFLWYSGKMEKDELDKLGWEPCDLKTLKADMQRVLDADSDLIKLKVQVSIQEDKINYLKSILQNISNRSFLFGHIIEARKMELGQL